MPTAAQKKIEEAKVAAIEVLHHNLHGPYRGLPRTAGWGYPEPYTRDLLICGLGALASQDKRLLASLRRVLETLAKNQSPRGQIPSLVHDSEDRGASDTTSLFLMILGMYRRFVGEQDDTLPRAPLTLARCPECGLLQLGDLIDPDLLYRNFWYASGINQTMRDALKEIVDDAFAFHGSGNWLDIGANDGTLLEYVPEGFTRIACEPALNFQEDLDEVSDRVVMDYFKADDYDEKFEVITSAAMFYDLDQPDGFVRDIAKVLAPKGIWINQLNDSPGMLRKDAWDGICHEHQVYYDVPNLKHLYERHGLDIIDLSHNNVNGGSIRVVAAHKRKYPLADLLGLNTPTRDQVDSFCRRVVKWKAVMKHLVPCLPKPIWGYGASTKGGTLLQYLDQPGFLSAIADRNPRKEGLMQSGVWVPIKGEADMRAAKPGTLFVLPWAFRDEFVEREVEARKDGAVMFFPLPNPEFVL